MIDDKEIIEQLAEDKPTLIYYVQTMLNTFKREPYNKNNEYAITLLSKAMEHQNDIWNDAIEAAADEVEALGSFAMAHEVRKLKK